MGGSPGGNGGAGSSPGVTRGPRVIDREEPGYPETAQVNGWQGTVRLRVLISEQGLVANVQVSVSSGYNPLDQAALVSMGN